MSEPAALPYELSKKPARSETDKGQTYSKVPPLALTTANEDMKANIVHPKSTVAAQQERIQHAFNLPYNHSNHL